MAITNIFTRTNPKIAGYEFDAVFEDDFESSVTLTGYPIELGARAADHRIIQPKKSTMTVGIGNNTLSTNYTDFIGAASYIDTNSGLLAAGLGLSAGFLAGSEETLASSALQKLLEIQASGESFDLDSGDIQLKNTTITRINRRRNAETEDGLIAVVEMQELPTLETIIRINSPKLSQLNANDPSYTQCGGAVDKGELVGSTPSEYVSLQVSRITG